MISLTKKEAQQWIKMRRVARRDMRRGLVDKKVAARYCRLATRLLDAHFGVGKGLAEKRRKDSKRYVERDNPRKL